MLRRLRDGTEGWVQFIHSSVIPVLKPFAQILFVSAVALIYLSGEFLRFIDFIPGGVFLLQALVAWLLINKVALMAVTFWTKRKTGADIQMTFWQKRLIVLSAIQTFWMSTLGTAIGVAAINTWAFVTAEYAAILPILAVIAAVALLAAGIIYLYERFESLRPIILILSPIIIGFWLLAKFIDKATDSMERFKDTFDTHIDIFDRHGLGFLNQGAGDLLGFGGGDRSTSPQLATVNSRASRDITDVNLPALLQQLQGQKMIIEPSAVNIDGREVGEIVWDHRLDRQARR
jgi:hypothetical protein